MATKIGEEAIEYWAKHKTKITTTLTGIAVVGFMVFVFWFNQQ